MLFGKFYFAEKCFPLADFHKVVTKTDMSGPGILSTVVVL